jgi:Zn/Cd-binding protein ZinT
MRIKIIISNCRENTRSDLLGYLDSIPDYLNESFDWRDFQTSLNETGGFELEATTDSFEAIVRHVTNWSYYDYCVIDLDSQQIKAERIDTYDRPVKLNDEDSWKPYIPEPVVPVEPERDFGVSPINFETEEDPDLKVVFANHVSGLVTKMMELFTIEGKVGDLVKTLTSNSSELDGILKSGANLNEAYSLGMKHLLDNPDSSRNITTMLGYVRDTRTYNGKHCVSNSGSWRSVYQVLDKETLEPVVPDIEVIKASLDNIKTLCSNNNFTVMDETLALIEGGL